MSTTTIDDSDVTQDMAVAQMHTGDSDSADIVFECNGKHIAVSMFSSHSSQDCHKSQHEQVIKDHLIDLLGQAVDDSDNYDDIVEDISDAIFNNVVIGNDNNAWLIDSGGGWTEGWVDKELTDTMEGDEQAVRNIAKFLGIN